MSELQDYITPEVLAQTIEMIREAQQDAKPIIVVEGDSDQKLMRNILRKFVDVLSSNGKWTALGAIQFLPEHALNNWVIIVIDADFDHLTETNYQEGIFLTDLHDFECEFIRSPALEKVVEEYRSSKRCKSLFGDNANNLDLIAQAIRDAVLSQSLLIGKLRYVSQLNDFQLKFKKLTNYKSIVKAKAIEIDFDRLVETVLAHGAKTGVTKESITNALATISDDDLCRWQVSQGHDVVKLFTLGMRRLWGRSKLTEPELETGLRLAFEAAHFWDTNLGRGLRERLEQLGIVFE